MSLDIRKGDLVKATNKKNPEVTVTTRLWSEPKPHEQGIYSLALDAFIRYDNFDFEVLERPIDEELLSGAVDAYVKKAAELNPRRDPLGHDYYEPNIRAVIEFINEYHNKESK